MTVKEQLLSEVEELDEESAAMVLAFVREVVAPSPVPPPDQSSNEARPRLTKPAVHVDAETLWRSARPLTKNDPLWGIVGLLDDDGPTDMSANKHKYLAEIYGDLHEE